MGGCKPILSAILSSVIATLGVTATIQDTKSPEQAPRVQPTNGGPAEFRAIYLTYWSVATPSRVEAVLSLAHDGLINAVVIDVKDVTGTVAFDTRVATAAEVDAKRVIIRDLDGLLNRLHAAGLYVIARLTVFCDPKLAAAKPEWGVHSTAKLIETAGLRSTDTLWRDRRDLAWVDPSITGVWDYNIAIARDAWTRGFDEINFDYIRFPSDGVLADMSFPVWDRTTERQTVMRAFFKHLRGAMGPAVISADFFGLSTVKHDDLGIGQVIEDALDHFDYVCPMVYPSHYAAGFIGKPEPAEYPYEVVYYSLKAAKRRLNRLGLPSYSAPRLRPWLQDFRLGAAYTPEMVAAQVQAARDSLGESYCGFALWNARNLYQREALEMVGRRAGWSTANQTTAIR